jgi:hypothetical protein
MNAPHPAEAAFLQPGQPLDGGFYAGTIIDRTDGHTYAIIVAPKNEGELATKAAWGEYEQLIENCRSFWHGMPNTEAMASAGSDIAKWARGLDINGFKDWYIPARDELELIYRNLKPTTDENWEYRGDNPSSLPAGYPYEATIPGQTSVADFQAGGAQAMKSEWYWSSTQASAYDAWSQTFDDGAQTSYDKHYQGRVRAVRRSLIQ